MKKFTSILMALLAIAGIFASSACSNKKNNMSTEDINFAKLRYITQKLPKICGL
ncbi:MAG: hypothetical protein NC388_09610 [Clostridium sp.]|nr:hypothetical protein [Clostridium sp.]